MALVVFGRSLGYAGSYWLRGRIGDRRSRWSSILLLHVGGGSCGDEPLSPCIPVPHSRVRHQCRWRRFPTCLVWRALVCDSSWLRLRLETAAVKYRVLRKREALTHAVQCFLWKAYCNLVQFRPAIKEWDWRKKLSGVNLCSSVVA